mmetsp:Transcript_58107/g.138238  ORF Transcript_58107/g.138238 Transcript_58107/m.138238 type:complete len:442 (-) Transcript_58107:42-1367(-)
MSTSPGGDSRQQRWRRGLSSPPSIALFALGLSFQPVAHAWCESGHEYVGRVAEGLLHGKHRDQIRTMMHSDPEDAATWQGTMLSKYPTTVGLQFHRQAPEWTCQSVGGLGVEGQLRCDSGADQSSLFCALAYFFEQFAHDALLKDFPQPAAPIGTPERLRLLGGIPSSELQPNHLLKWLMILVADLHQPLHWQRERDYGREVQVKYKGEQYSLYDFWEDYIPKHLLNPTPSSDGSKALDKDYQRKSETWGHRLPTDLFRDWAKEVAEKLCIEVYQPIQTHDQSGAYVIANDFEITEELFTKWVRLAEDLLTSAGERLAYVFNEILEHKRHKEASADGRALPSKRVVVGTAEAVATAEVAKAGVSPTSAAATSAGSSHSAPTMQKKAGRRLVVETRSPRQWSVMWNLGIAAVVVPLLLLGFHWHLQVGGGSIYRLGKEHLKM